MAGILNEVRLARTITHPAVCRVFDVGEANGEVFFSMELVRGEDLAALIRRVGRLPSEKVVDIGRQLCAGLAAAHAEGVLHRDLKPANVLIDQNGQVRITDFGIAVSRVGSGLHTPVGTPAYMAPEQLLPGAPQTERTDVYALGVLLYELVSGQHPFNRGTCRQPTRPSALIPHIDPHLERVILQALSPDPRERPASADAFAAALSTAAPAMSAHRSSWWLTGSLAAAIVLSVVALAAPFLRGRGASALTGQDTIVLADFTNTTGEPVFDGTLKVALAVAVEQSPFLKVFPDERVRETLRLMNRRPEEPVTPAIAREIAQREQLKALFAGSIAPLGHNYVLAVEAVNALTGDVMAREQAEVTGKEKVLTALGDVASRLRKKLGESLASLQKFDVSLPRATTASLDALHAYALALDEGRMNLRLEAIPHLKRAIELDPDFAMALAQLSGVYANTSQTALAPELSRRAFALRDRVSERERFFISWRYYRDAAQAWDKALELAQSWTTTYPREAFAFNSLGVAYTYLGQYRSGCRGVPAGQAPRSEVRSRLFQSGRRLHGAEPVRGGDGHSQRGGRATRRVHRQSPDCLPHRLHSRRRGFDVQAFERIGRTRHDQRGLRLAGARPGLPGPALGRARGVPPGRADGVPERLQGSGGAARHRGRGVPRHRRAVRPGSAGGPGGPGSPVATISRWSGRAASSRCAMPVVTSRHSWPSSSAATRRRPSRTGCRCPSPRPSRRAGAATGQAPS